MFAQSNTHPKKMRMENANLSTDYSCYKGVSPSLARVLIPCYNAVDALDGDRTLSKRQESPHSTGNMKTGAADQTTDYISNIFTKELRGLRRLRNCPTPEWFG